jgi:hypothetical protein
VAVCAGALRPRSALAARGCRGALAGAKKDGGACGGDGGLGRVQCGVGGVQRGYDRHFSFFDLRGFCGGAGFDLENRLPRCGEQQEAQK